MCAERMPDVLARPAGGGDLAAGGATAAPVRRVVTAQASAAIRGNTWIIREFAVLKDITQNGWAPMAITTSSLAPASAIAVART
jgi:hypothetical protein